MLRLRGRGGSSDRLVSDSLLAEPSSLDHTASSTPQQLEAVAALIDHTDGDLFAWLKLVRSARSIEPIPEQRSGSVHLSPRQIRALFALKDCPNDRLFGLLLEARLSRSDSTAAASALGPSFHHSGLNNTPSSFIQQSDPSSFEQKLWMEPTEQASSQPGYSSRSRQFAASDLAGHNFVESANPSSIRHTDNHYWCTVCENPNSYRDSGNWKKHEKGHETIFVCGLDDAVEEDAAGQSTSAKRFSCKRRDIMVNHLYKSHGISAVQQARDLADKWRKSVKKQAWSCGFCVSVFVNFQDRLKHIDIEHFKKYENIRDWDFNKVIHGLLLQSKMENAWKKRTTSLLPWTSPDDLVWPEAFAQSMRTKLEIGPSDENDANALAHAVFSACEPKEAWSEIATASDPFVSSGMAGANPRSSSNQGRLLGAQASRYDTDHCQSPFTNRATAIIPDASPFGRLPKHPYSHGSTTGPTMISSDEGSLGNYITPPFYPYQSGVATSEWGNGYSSYDGMINKTY